MEKLFTTHDGVDIYPGDKYFTVRIKDQPITEEWLQKFPEWFRKSVVKNNPDGIIHAYKEPIAGPYINPEALKPTGNIAYFKHKENAQEFINENTFFK